MQIIRKICRVILLKIPVNSHEYGRKISSWRLKVEGGDIILFDVGYVMWYVMWCDVVCDVVCDMLCDICYVMWYVICDVGYVMWVMWHKPWSVGGRGAGMFGLQIEIRAPSQNSILKKYVLVNTQHDFKYHLFCIPEMSIYLGCKGLLHLYLLHSHKWSFVPFCRACRIQYRIL